MGIFSKKKQNNENAVIKENLQKCVKRLTVFYLTIMAIRLYGHEGLDEFHRNTNYYFPIILGHVRADYEHFKGSTSLTDNELTLIKEVCRVSMVSNKFCVKYDFFSESTSENQEYMEQFFRTGKSIANALREDHEKWIEKLHDLVSNMEEFNEICFDVAGKNAEIMIEYEKGRVAKTLSSKLQLDYTNFCDLYELSTDRVSELSKDPEELQEYIYEQSLKHKCPK